MLGSPRVFCKHGWAAEGRKGGARTMGEEVQASSTPAIDDITAKPKTKHDAPSKQPKPKRETHRA